MSQLRMVDEAEGEVPLGKSGGAVVWNGQNAGRTA